MDEFFFFFHFDADKLSFFFYLLSLLVSYVKSFTCFRCRDGIYTNLFCYICMVWALTKWEAFAKIALLLNVEVIRPSGFSFPLCRIPLLVRGLLRKSRVLRLSLLLPPSLLKGGRGGWVLGLPLVLLPVGLPLLLLVRCSLGLFFSSAPLGAGVPGVVRCGGRLLPALPSYHRTPCEVMS